MNPMKSSDPSKHRPNINHLHGVSCQMLQAKIARTRKNLEASYIAPWKHDLNEQKKFERLFLFINCVT